MNVATDELISDGSNRVVIPFSARSDDAGTGLESGDYVCIRAWLISNEGSSDNLKSIKPVAFWFVVGRLPMFGLFLVAGREFFDFLP